MHISLANLYLNFSRDVVAILRWLSVADNSLSSVAIVLGALVPLAVELHGIDHRGGLKNRKYQKRIMDMNFLL